ncbi:MAG: LysR family transcriptional regulator [Rhizorhabdus sp.]
MSEKERIGMIEMTQVDCFLTVVEKSSFSKAAIKLGLAQSAVSQRVQRLEDQLGFRLIDRTSREVRLSAEGAEFMPHARRMIEAEAAARLAARRLTERQNNRIRLGGYGFLSDERIEFVNFYMAAVPDTSVEVESGTSEEMLSLLRQGRIDALFRMAPADTPMKEFPHVFLRRVRGYLVIPPGHSLAGCGSVSRGQLAGMAMALSPGRQDAQLLNQIREELSDAGAIPIPAPEADRRAILAFARVHNMPSLLWLNAARPPCAFRSGEDSIVPITDDPLHLDHYLYTLPGPRRSLVEEFIRTACLLTERDGEDAGTELKIFSYLRPPPTAR